MKKTKKYRWTIFSPEVLKEASAVFEQKANPKSEYKADLVELIVSMKDEQWDYDSEEEFFADYRKPSLRVAKYSKSSTGGKQLYVWVEPGLTQVTVDLDDRPAIEAVFEVFESHLKESRIPEPAKPPSKPTVFIGHGRSTLWRDLKDHLHEKHGYPVEAYEIGARAGHTIRDILEQMLEGSSFALLVMTGEDETAEGTSRARQNVVHELGLFQGRLGFSKAIVLLEEGTEEFSNIHGIQQIRFSRDNIKETFGEVLATLRREFSDDAT